MTTIQTKHTIPPLLIPVYCRRISNLRKVQQIVKTFPGHSFLDRTDFKYSIDIRPG